MARVNWAAIGERYYETGIDRGMLYVGSLPGVAWSGLISVDESPSGGELKSHFFDGRIYLNSNAPEQFRATINAFYSPPEFDACDGIVPAALGLFATNQRRQTFGMSYRTRIGNDVSGPKHGYKIHLVYNALAAPASRNYTTISDDPDTASLSWNIVAKPVQYGDTSWSAHYIIDSTITDPTALAALEDILYGSDVEIPHLPDLWTVITMLNSAAPFTIIDNGDGTFTAIGSNDAVSMISGGIFQLSADTVILDDDDHYTASSSEEV